MGKNIINKRITPHILRHSSVTYYASLLNHQQLCYRYGWTMASDMPNRYIDREGLIEEETRELVKTHDLSNLEKQNKKLKEEISFIKESNKDLNDQIVNMQDKLDSLFQGKDFLKLLAYI